MGIGSSAFLELAERLVDIVRLNTPDATDAGIANIVAANICGKVNEIAREPSFPNVPPLAWSAAPPTVPGWYWSRPVGAQQAECVRIGERGGRICVIYDDEEAPPDEYAKWCGGEWYGPIAEPPA